MSEHWIHNFEQAEETYAELNMFYIHFITEACKAAGSADALSEALGHKSDYVANIIKRNKFAAMRRLVLEIKEAGLNAPGL